jgi:hypothetical protein
LTAAAIVHGERLAGRAVSAALNPETDDAKAAGIALSIIREAEPRDSATLEIAGEVTPESIDQMSFSELLRLAESLGIDPSATPPQLPA